MEQRIRIKKQKSCAFLLSFVSSAVHVFSFNTVQNPDAWIKSINSHKTRMIACLHSNVDQFSTCSEDSPPNGHLCECTSSQGLFYCLFETIRFNKNVSLLLSASF